MQPLLITHYTTSNPLGLGRAATRAALVARRGALRPCDVESAPPDTWIGRVAGIEEQPVAGALAEFDCRNNRLAQIGLRQDGFEQAVARARARYGAERVAVIVGTSTSGIAQCERAYRERDARDGALPGWFRERQTLNLFSVADFVQRSLGLQGPAATISTACSSSAKAFASAVRLMQAGYADAAVVGGVDSLCLTTLHGFGSLGLLSREACRPCDAARDGISIGEAAGFALLERTGAAGVALVGYGESSDAHHLSSPDPDGEGAFVAMREALGRAGVGAREIDYVNLHGTGTPANDRIEDRAVFRLFGDATRCSSTKGWTGHTLGAAGITEAVISLICLEEGLVPGCLNVRQLDPALASRVVLEPESRALRYVVSNSIGFGGSNCSLLFARLA